MKTAQLFNSNNLDILRNLPDNSIDSIITDPPYGISFMGKKWDYDVPSVETWKECLRVLKPGGHILIACGTRTQHRMAVNIEDAGFEIRDIVAWIYGSGFPKSLNIGKAVDKLQGNEREVVGKNPNHRVSDALYELGFQGGKGTGNLSKGNSPYEGWGTALKPAMELWTMARKPLSEKNVASNVLKWGTGGINIDGSRVGNEELVNRPAGNKPGGNSLNMSVTGMPKNAQETTANGRFPANVIHDGSDEVTDLFPNDSQRFFYCAKASKGERNAGLDGFEEKNVSHDGRETYIENPYQRHENIQKNNHPTVKPVALMRYLVKMITPAGGMVLDPFMGSGSTGVACMKENFSFTGIELDPEYFKIAEARINNA